MTDSTAMEPRDSSLLLATFQRTATERLSAALDAVLQRADDYLFDRSSSGADGAELTALRDLRRARAQLSRHYGQALAAGFQRMQGKVGSADDDAMPVLTLLAEDALEEQLATEQIVENLNRKYAGALELLDKRLADLLQRQALAAGENPVAPGAITDALRSALRTVEVSTSVRIALYKFAEREFTTALSPLYDRLNVSLADAGILPQLRPTKSRGEPASNPKGQEGTQAQAQQTEGAYGPGTGIPEPGAGAEAAPANDTALFGSLLQMLQSWRQRATPAGQQASGCDASAPLLQTPEIMSVLSLMQSDPPPGLDLDADDTRGSLAEQLRREVVAGAQRLGVGHGGLNLSSEHEDAVDLVGMLFDVLLDERDFEPEVRRKIGRMLVPYVKVAVKDRRLFLFKGHPARRFLNAVAEACVGNHGEEPQERALLERVLLERVDDSIDRVVNEFNEDVAIFETLEQELRSFLVQHRQRIEIAERRAAEAQNGRERLDLAREQATSDVDACRDQRQLPAVMHDFLGRHASHHLVQVALRDGRESGRYQGAIKTLKALLSSFDHAELGTDMERMPAPTGTAWPRSCPATAATPQRLPTSSIASRTACGTWPATIRRSQRQRRHQRSRSRLTPSWNPGKRRASKRCWRSWAAMTNWISTRRWPSACAHCRSVPGCSWKANPGTSFRRKSRGSARFRRASCSSTVVASVCWWPRPKSLRRWPSRAGCSYVLATRPSMTPCTR